MTEDPGIIPRAMRALLSKSPPGTQVVVSYLELYKEKVCRNGGVAE